MTDAEQRRARWKCRWYMLRSLHRWVLGLECKEPYCHARRRCWWVHDETMICPTCKTQVGESDPRWPVIFKAIFENSERGTTAPPPLSLQTASLSMTSGATLIVKDCRFETFE